MTTETRRQFAETMPVPSLALPRVGRARTDIIRRRQVDALVARAGEWFCLSPEEIVAPGIKHEPAMARWCVYYVLRQRGWTLERIAHAFGRKHSTVSIGLKKCAIRMRHEKDLVDAVAYVERGSC